MASAARYSFRIRTYHTGPDGRLRLDQLFNLLQEAAHSHADELGFGQDQLTGRKLFWVLSRLCIRCAELPERGEEVKVVTWVNSLRGAVSERSFSLIDRGREWLTARSVWFCLDAASQRPVRLPEEYAARMPVAGQPAVPEDCRKITGFRGEAVGRQNFRIMPSDIDMVGHVNNAVYIRWMTDILPGEMAGSGRLESFEVNFLDQCFAGEEVQVRCYRLPAGEYGFDIYKRAGDRAICRGLARFKQA